MIGISNTGIDMNQKGIPTLGIVLLGLALPALSALAQPPERPTQPFMRQKLAFASGVLEGITLERFGLVVTNATALRDMSQTNAFLRLRNPNYLELTTNFQANVDALIAAAKAKNLSAATAAYEKTTESCVECHKSFRREQFILDRSGK